MLIKIRDSMRVGSAKTFSFLVSLNFSNKKAEVNEPNKNEKIYKKYMVPFQNSKWDTSLTKRAKCPVTFVVSCLKDKKPVTLTKPATKDKTVARWILCFNVLLLP